MGRRARRVEKARKDVSLWGEGESCGFYCTDHEETVICIVCVYALSSKRVARPLFHSLVSTHIGRKERKMVGFGLQYRMLPMLFGGHGQGLTTALLPPDS